MACGGIASGFGPERASGYRNDILCHFAHPALGGTPTTVRVAFWTPGLIDTIIAFYISS